MMQKTSIKSLLIMSLLILAGCASSDIQRNAATGAESMVQNTSNYLDNAKKSDIPGGFENSSQAAKGAIIGGGAGAIVGGLTSVGMLPGVAGGIVIGGAFGALFDAHGTLADSIENRGGKVMVLGDQVMIVLPSRFIFRHMTNDINTSAYSTLDLVGQYINKIENTSIAVHVAAYSNDDDAVNRALTKQQADAIVKYLWRQGVNTRLLTASGMGGQHLVQAYNSDWERGANYRIEITLEKLPV